MGVGEVIGKHCLFLTPEEVRTVALTPGSTLYRLLTDPVTGTLIERSTTAYRFDTAMRAYIIAADVFCRAPGCLRPAALSQIDHVQEYGTPGGHTCISNGQAAHEPHHDLKTKKLWDATITANRDVTWTTLLRRIYTTKAHDYTQYTRLLTAATTHITDAVAAGTDPAAAVDTAIYQALSYRPPTSRLQAADDDPWDTEQQFTSWDQITLTHTPQNGRRTYHPDPHTTRAEHDRHHASSTTDDTDSTDTATATTMSNGTGGTTATPSSDGPTTPWTPDPDAPPPF